jgi:putative ABC transport system permease protein
MLKNYLKIAWRNLFKNKFFSAINIFGLALGMACSILILLWVQNELSIDSFHANDNRLYAVYERQFYDNKIEGQYRVPGLLADELKTIIPDVEYAVNAEFGEKHTFRAGEKIIKLEGGAAGPDMFKMFSYKLLQGSPETALKTVSDIAISRKMAEDFFGSTQAAIGKTIRYENRQDFTVSAVFENLPENTSYKFEYLINWVTYLQENEWAKKWDNNGPLAYVMLRKDANQASVDKKLVRFMDNYYKPDKSFREELGLQKFSEVYLHSNFKNGKHDGGRIEYVNLFSIVAAFLLLIACINFMNLTTARSIKRAREIGIRKVVGAVRSGLIQQFIGEAIMLTMFAVVIALVLVAMLLPLFNQVTQKQMFIPFGSGYFWLCLLGLTLVTGVISGSYPALFLSSFNPVKILKGTLQLSSSSTMFRKGLVVFQFSLSVVLIIGTIVVSKQINYIQNMNLGYDRENMVYIPLEGSLPSKYEVFKDAALNMPGVQSVSRVLRVPTNFSSTTGNIVWDGKDPNLNVEFTYDIVGYDFAKTMKLKMVQGHDFSKDIATDTTGYIINEAGLKRIGYKDPIGKPLTMWGKKGKIVGIVQDFHFNSLHDKIEPLIIKAGEDNDKGSVLVRIQRGQTKPVLVAVENICKQVNPEFTFSYAFADQEYQRLYQSEQVVGKLANAFAFLAIFITCLGLLGLAMFTAEQRTREIGIRKVLGASVGSVFAMLSREFLILVFIALFIASPLAWYLTNQWLMNFAYRTPVQWWVFGLAGVIAIMVTFVTISFQSAKAALMNPVKSLRSE